MPAVWRDFFQFVRWPAPTPACQRMGRGWIGSFVTLSALMWTGLIVWLGLVLGAEHLLSIDAPPRVPWTHSARLLAALSIVVAPVVEEIAFRSWLPLTTRPARKRASLAVLFPVAVWTSTIAFALLHLTNFRDGPASVSALLFVVPQLWSGLIFAFARMRLGLVAAILLHASINAIVFLATHGLDGEVSESWKCRRTSDGSIHCVGQETGRNKFYPPPSAPVQSPTAQPRPSAAR